MTYNIFKQTQDINDFANSLSRLYEKTVKGKWHWLETSQPSREALLIMAVQDAATVEKVYYLLREPAWLCSSWTAFSWFDFANNEF